MKKEEIVGMVIGLPFVVAMGFVFWVLRDAEHAMVIVKRAMELF